MNLIFLRYFVDSYRIKSLTKAAKLNNVSVTAISKGIKSLEDSLGYTLVDHQKNQLVFNKQADRIYNQAIDILESVNNLGISTDIGPKRIRIGLIHSLATGRLSRLIAQLAEEIDLNISICNPTEMENLYSRYLIDFGISLKREVSNLSQTIILHEGNFNLYESNEVKLKNKVLYITPDWPEVDELKKIMNEKDLKQLKICVIDSWDAIYSAVKKGGGIGLLPDYFKINNNKIKQVKKNDYKFKYFIVLKYHNSFYDEVLFKKFKYRFVNTK